MKKKKLNKVETAYDKYIDRLQDLLCNPINEDKSNEEIDPLFMENDNMMLEALLKDEDETCQLLTDEVAFDNLIAFLPAIQEHFGSKIIADTLNDTFKVLEEGKGCCKYSQSSLKEIKEKVDEANKYVK